jgi:hypothetical protein
MDDMWTLYEWGMLDSGRSLGGESHDHLMMLLRRRSKLVIKRA